MFIHPDVARLLTEERIRDVERALRRRPQPRADRGTVRPPSRRI